MAGALCNAVRLSLICALRGTAVVVSKNPRRHGLAMLEVHDLRDLQLTHASTFKAYNAHCHGAAAEAAQLRRKCKHSILMDLRCSRVHNPDSWSVWPVPWNAC